MEFNNDDERHILFTFNFAINYDSHQGRDLLLSGCMSKIPYGNTISANPTRPNGSGQMRFEWLVAHLKDYHEEVKNVYQSPYLLFMRRVINKLEEETYYNTEDLIQDLQNLGFRDLAQKVASEFRMTYKRDW